MARTIRHNDDTDAAHESDMRQLRKEQLAAEEWELEHSGFPEDEPFEWDNNV